MSFLINLVVRAPKNFLKFKPVENINKFIRGVLSIYTYIFSDISLKRYKYCIKFVQY